MATADRAANDASPLRRGSRWARAALVAPLAVALAAGPAPQSLAPAAAITPQAEQVWETGVIRGVVDGDTVLVDVTWAADPAFIAPPASADPALPSARTYCDERLNPDGSMPGPDGDLDRCRIRLIGIQAPEKAGAAGGSALAQCHAGAATAALAAQLPSGTPVQLRAISSRSVEQDYSGGRLARTVYRPDGSGGWVDAGRAVLAGGHAMWFPHNLGDAEKPEYAHNLEYRRLVDSAAARGLGLWSAGPCGPSGPASLRTWAVSDPIGEDAGNEYVVLQNDADVPLDVSGWTVRDSSLTTVALPPGTVIGPRDHIRVFTGAGAPGIPTARDLRFGGPAQMFANWDPAAGYFYGDGVYVHDVQPGFAYGNLRAWFHYPCDPDACTDPLAGRVRFGTIVHDPPGADTAAGEFVELVNTSGAPVALGGYALTRQGAQFPFPPATVIPAGGTLRVSVGVGIDDATTVHLGRTASLLANAGDLLTLANLNHAVVDCRAWGTFSCAGLPTSPAVSHAPAPPAKRATSARPGPPLAVTAAAAGKRIRARWAPPAPDGSAKVTRYRVRVHHKVGKKQRLRATCYASAKRVTCRTKKLKKRTTYTVSVQARNKKGYGPAAAIVRVRVA